MAAPCPETRVPQREAAVRRRPWRSMECYLRLPLSTASRRSRRVRKSIGGDGTIGGRPRAITGSAKKRSHRRQRQHLLIGARGYHFLNDSELASIQILGGRLASPRQAGTWRGRRKLCRRKLSQRLHGQQHLPVLAFASVTTPT
jgi:hypothetical protein